MFFDFFYFCAGHIIRHQRHRIILACQFAHFLFQCPDYFFFSFSTKAFFFFTSSSSSSNCPIFRSARDNLESSGLRLKPSVPFWMNSSLHVLISDTATAYLRLNSSKVSPFRSSSTTCALNFDVCLCCFILQSQCKLSAIKLV